MIHLGKAPSFVCLFVPDVSERDPLIPSLYKDGIGPVRVVQLFPIEIIAEEEVNGLVDSHIGIRE